VVSKFLLTAMRGGVLKVNGARETLDFTYVDDVAQGIVAATLSERASNNTYNITRSQSWPLLAAANLAVEIAGQGTVEIHDKDNNFPSRGALNIDAARRDFGYNPKIDIEQGFQRYYEWLDNSVYWSKKTV
jgi:nucleoside-diphosphate-sugar epimerase